MLLRNLINFLGLFSSFSTLFCCALPALFVALGLGASFVGLLDTFPQLIWLSEHKTGLFIFAGIMLSCSLALRVLNQQQTCPADPLLAKACQSSRKISNIVLPVSLLLYATGGFFAFVAPLLW